jgi:hypothetical protein
MSTPLVAAAAALVRQHLAESRGMREPSAALLRAVLAQTATDLFPGQFGTGPFQEIPTRRPNDQEGYGRVDAARATALDGARIEDDPVGLATGETRVFDVVVGEAGRLTATLAWTDAPGEPLAETVLVNDLDLEVTGPGGFARTSGDRLNNLETLELAGLAPGSYRVTVRGVNVPAGKGDDSRQPYALVIDAAAAAR